jgi:hypothetical protein
MGKKGLENRRRPKRVSVIKDLKKTGKQDQEK